MSMYQFLIAVRTQDGSQLTNDSGETTSYVLSLIISHPQEGAWPHSSIYFFVERKLTRGLKENRHLMGFFHRTIRMVENDLKPCYVFDGKPPALKSNVVSSSFTFFRHVAPSIPLIMMGTT
jgi:flap endonuclease-1